MLWRSPPRPVRLAMGALICLTYLWLAMAADAQDAVWPAKTHYRYSEVEGKRIFYREAGDPSRAPSSMAIGLDQIPESLFPLLACRLALPLTMLDIGVATIVFFVGELVLSRILFRLHLRDRPY